MGRLIRHHELVPDVVVSSTARRAHRTADLVADACGYEKEICATGPRFSNRIVSKASDWVLVELGIGGLS